MTIEAQLDDGRVLEFPDGTDPTVIQATVKRMVAGGGQAPSGNVQAPNGDVPTTEGISVAPTIAEDRGVLETIGGGLSAAATVAGETTGTAVGGLTALVDLFNPFTDNDPVKTIENIKSKFGVAPSVGGQAALDEIAGIIEPAQPLINAVSEFKKNAGQQGLDLTGSPAFATFVEIIPDILLEAAGVGAGQRVARTSVTSRDVPQAKTSAISAVDEAQKTTGVRQLTTDLFPPKTRVGKFLRDQGELIDGGNRSAQQAERVRSIDKLLTDYGVEEGARFESSIVKSLKDSVNESKKAIGKLYDESSKQLDTLGTIPLQKTKEFAQGIIDRELKKGTLADEAVISDMQSLVDAPADMTFEVVKEIRSGVGETLGKVERGAPVQGNSNTGLLKRTYAQLTKDMTDFAEAADPKLAAKWKKADAVVSEFAIGTKKQGVKSIIKNGDATPEVVDTLLFSKKNSDLEFLARNLNDAGKLAAKQRILQRITEKATGADLELNPNGFQKGLAANRNQIGKFFEPVERRAIEALRDTLSSTRRAQDSAVTTATGQAVVPLFLLKNPEVLIPGVIQAIIERPIMRNLIIKRKAAKTARQRALIDSQLQAEIDKSGIIAAGGVAAVGNENEN